MLHATGLTQADLEKPQVGIGAVYFESNPCNMHSESWPTRSNAAWKTPASWVFVSSSCGVSDGISMGTDA